MKYLAIFFYIIILNGTIIPFYDLSWSTIVTPNYDILWITAICVLIPSALSLVTTILLFNFLINLVDLGLVFFLNRNLYLGIDYKLLNDFNNFGTMNYGNSFYLIYVLLILMIIIYAGGLNDLLKKFRKNISSKKIIMLPLIIISFAACYTIHHNLQPNKSFIFRNYKDALASFDNIDHLSKFREDIQISNERTSAIINKHPVHRPNIYLFIIESYGLSALRLNENIIKYFEEIPSEINKKNFYSGILESPVFGGQSWMAYASLNCGLHIDNQLKFKAMFRSQIKCLPEIFNDMGYYTGEMKPGTTKPILTEEKNKYKFNQSIIATHLNYQGPPFGWGSIPDEYSLARFFLDFFPKIPLGPKFFQFFLVSTHAPWTHTLPLLGLNEETIENYGQNYSGLRRKTLGETDEAYTKSILYDLALIKLAIKKFMQADDLVIILGDHPPNRLVTNFYQRNLVPIHLMAPPHLDKLSDFFSKGLIPEISRPPMKMEYFSEKLLRVLFQRKQI